MGVMEARRRILLNQPHLIDASGNPIAFQTDMAAKMGVKAHFAPVQSGSGDPSPSNVRPISGWTGCEVTRCGKNLFNPAHLVSGKYFNRSGTMSENVSFSYAYVRVNAGEKIIFSGLKGANGNPIGVQFFDINKEFVSDLGGSAQNNNTVYTVPNGAYYVGVSAFSESNQTYNDVNSLQLELGSIATTYTPYSGAAYPVTFPAVGKNLFNVNGDLSPLYAYAGNMDDASSVFSVVNGAITYGVAPGSSYGRMFKIGYCKTGTYTLSLNWNGTTASGRWYLLGYDNPIEIGKAPPYITIKNSLQFSDATTTFTLSSAKYVYALLSDTSYNSAITISDIQLESGSTATSYEPFTNTLYGGYVDYERGEVVATHKTITITGNESRTYYVYNNSLYNDGSILSDSKNGSSLYGKCSVQTNTSSGLIDVTALVKASATKGIQFNNVTTKWGLSEVSSNALIAKLQEWNAAGTPLQICYELATPIHYPLTPAIIKSLKGTNTVWSDMNGNLEISYWKH